MWILENKLRGSLDWNGNVREHFLARSYKSHLGRTVAIKVTLMYNGHSDIISRTGENPLYGMIGGTVETSASFEARYAPLSYPTGKQQGTIIHPSANRP